MKYPEEFTKVGKVAIKGMPYIHIAWKGYVANSVDIH